MGLYVWFGGQGSKELFSSVTVKRASADAKSSHIAASLTSRCHQAWINETQSLDYATRRRLNLDHVFPTSQDFFKLDPSLHTNGVVQSTIFCLYQLLRIICVAQKYPSGCVEFLKDISEVTGFCSGLLAAAIVACSSTDVELVDNGVQAFRLSFWIAVRSSLYVQERYGKPKPGASCLLAIKNTLEEEVQNNILDFDTKCLEGCLNIATIVDTTTISVSGCPEDLSAFRSKFYARSKFAYVHNIYHGGQSLEPVASDVLKDTSTRLISFSNHCQAHRFLRSTRSGLLLSGTDSENTLIKFIVRQILVECVAWDSVCSEFRSHLQSLPGEQVLCVIGPGSELLINTLQSPKLCENVTIVDESFSDIPKPADQLHLRKDSQDIAIIGMGLRFPGSNDVFGLWDTILNAKDISQPIPADRFNGKASAVGGGKPLEATLGGFLDDIWSFDAGFFNISPREAQSMDPQQRITLEAAQAALEDSGYCPSSSASTRPDSIGCFVGVATGDYVHNLQNDIDVYYSTGTLRAFISGKLSYVYNLSGPSVVVDTACSSSLVAIHQACQSLRLGDCSMAIAGGVNTISSPDMFVGLDRAHFLSHSGGCKPFDAAADGYGRSEGCGLFVLKRLSDAIADNDRIHAVIKGTAINQNGLSQSITRPHAETQVNLFNSLLEKAGVDRDTISYVEAHGTGTQVGDRTETDSLCTLFKGRASDNPLFIGSVKACLGHSEAASGAAGLAKLCLMMRYRKIPQQRLSQINPVLSKIFLESFVIPEKSYTWEPKSPADRLTALLNNFGAAGSNCALILQEYKPPALPKTTEVLQPSYLLSVSANSSGALKTLLSSYVDTLSASKDMPLADFCYSASARRQRYKYQTAFVCDSTDHAIEMLSSALQKKEFTTIQPSRKVVFVFSGQGSLYYGMGEELVSTNPFIQDIVMKCSAYLESLGVHDVRRYFYTPSEPSSPLTSVEHFIGSQCACVILEYSVARFLTSVGVTPAVVIGHSLGEYSAIAVSGMLSIQDVLLILVRRAELMIDHCTWGISGMIACQLGIDEARNHLAMILGPENNATIACQNSSKDCVVSASNASIDKLHQHFQETGIKCKRLEVPLGFHSDVISVISDHLTLFCQDVDVKPPRIPIFSNVTGEQLTASNLQASYFSSHACKPVRFSTMMATMRSRFKLDSSVFLEVGPHPTTLPIIRADIPPEIGCCYIPVLRKDKSAWQALLSCLSELINVGIDIVSSKVFIGTGSKLRTLPGHPLYRETYCVPYQPLQIEAEGKTAPSSKSLNSPLLWKKVTDWGVDGEKCTTFEADSHVLSGYIKGHVVGGIAICPASVYNELILETATEVTTSAPDKILTLNKISFPSPLVYSDPASFANITTMVEISVDPKTSIISVVVWSHLNGSSQRRVHCTAEVCQISLQDIVQEWRKTSIMISRQTFHILQLGQKPLNIFTKSILYDRVFTRVVRYSKPYQTLVELKVLDVTLQGIGKFTVANVQDEFMVTNPVFVDTLLHSAGFIANISVASDTICVCTHVDGITILPKSLEYSNEFVLYCSLFDIDSDGFVADAYVSIPGGRVIGSVTGMQFKAVKLASLESHLRRIAGVSSSRVENGAQKPEGILASPKLTPPKGQATAKGTLTPSTPKPNAELRQLLYSIFSRVCGKAVPTLSPDQTLDCIGFDSLMFLELESELRTIFQGSNASFSLAECETIGDIEKAVYAQYGSSSILTPCSISSGAESSSQSEVSDTGEGSSITTSPDHTTTVCRAIAEVCNIPAGGLSEAVKLEDIGIDSLLRMELGDKLTHMFGISIDLCDHTASKTIGDVCCLLPQQDKVTAGPLARTPACHELVASPTLLHRSTSSNAPLILVHDGSGLSSTYGKLGDLNRALYGYQSSPLGKGKELGSMGTVQDMARSYLAALGGLNLSEFILGGWSFGGAVAYEMVCQALDIGLAVKGLILIDSPPPINHTPIDSKIIEAVLATPEVSSLKKPKKMSPSLAKNFKLHAEILGSYSPSRSPITGIPVIMLKSSETIDTKALSGIDYPWLSDQGTRKMAIQSWNKLLGQDLVVRDIHGNHFSAFAAANIKGLTEQLNLSLNMIDRQ